MSFVAFGLVCFLVFTVINLLRRKRNYIAFFHPYCNDGGGGERVLWCAIQGLLQASDKVKIAVYTGDHESSDAIFAKAKERFGVTFDTQRVILIRLAYRGLLEAKYYPAFTLLGQSLGSMLVVSEALFRFVPDVFIDTTGCAFTYPSARFLFGCSVACYVHYPTISTDMLSLVNRREESYNNRAFISRSSFLTHMKIIYYRLFAFAYGLAGKCSHVVMCNSSWTRAHIREIWGVEPKVVFPPCNTEVLEHIPLEGRDLLAISIGQFRPEKNHALQLEAFSLLRERGLKQARLAIIGSCRNAEDEARVRQLRERIKALGLEGAAEILVNVPKEELVGKWMRRARAGLHTMRNEHFGISVVELMAAGVVAVAHRSGGPLEDIVVEWDGGATGYLAATAEEYAEAVEHVMRLPARDVGMVGMQVRARAASKRFSDGGFQAAFLSALGALPFCSLAP